MRIWRICAVRNTLFAAALALAVLTHGCQAGISRRVVEQAMSGKAGANVPADTVKKAGEQAIPTIFEVVRDSSDEMVPDRALLIMVGMTAMHTADPCAPFIRKVLADAKEPERIRVLAAKMLSLYWEAPEPERALISHARSDASEAVRIQCVASSGGLMLWKLPRTKDGAVDGPVRQLLADVLQDKSTKVREQACNTVAVIASEALYEGTELDWCRRLLVQAKQDKDYRVRKAAVEGLFVLESIRKTSRS